jgi:hypothetical protein
MNDFDEALRIAGAMVARFKGKGRRRGWFRIDGIGWVSG